MPSYGDIIQTLINKHALQDLRNYINTKSVINDAITIQQIPAPTFHEAQRAQAIAKRFTEHKLRDIAVDHLHNVYGRLPGHDPRRPALLVAAHTDTVFPADTDLRITRRQRRICGPGLGDNSLGVAGLLASIRLFEEHNIQPATDIWFVANTREEGLGDLGGIRGVWDRVGKQLGAAIVIEGMALGRIYHAGIAVRRLRIVSRAPGGHSWLHYGQPSAVHGLITLGARILALKTPQKSRTTYNIGLINGGHSVNSLATTAELYLDLRSETADSLSELEHQIHNAIGSVQKPKLTFETTIVGDRPAGNIPTDHPLVQLAATALVMIDYVPLYERGSTDANLLLANGLPTITVGISHGGQAHRLDEYIDIGPIADGMWQLVLLTVAAADQLHLWSR